MGQRVMAPPVTEAQMIEPQLVRQLRQLQARGWGSKRIAGELGVARNTVRRYLRGGSAAEKQERPAARVLDEAGRRLAVDLFDGEAEGNAVVVTELLRERGVDVGLRTVQKVTAGRRRERVAEAVASVRFETAPGAQMQIDFGQKLVMIAGAIIRVHLLVAVLSYSRRIFVKAFLAERQDDWREGIAGAFRHFGGLTRTVLGDNARSLVLAHDRAAQTVTFHPGYLQFCRDWDVAPRRVRALPRSYKRKDGVWGQVRQTQWPRRSPLRLLRGARDSSRVLDASGRRTRARHHARDPYGALSP